MEQASPPTAPPTKELDTVVKLGLSVFVGAFVLIWGGMFLTRPDRTIPPYSIGSQAGTAVAVHVPTWTSDTEIETLIYRFQKIAHEGREFGRMKIQPTTNGDPAEQAFKAEFEKTVRGFYRLDGTDEEGRIGRIHEVLQGKDTAAIGSPEGPADKPASSPLSPF